MGNDVAGPMLGWSLGSGHERRRLHELLDFPCMFSFKAVGRAEAGVDGNTDDGLVANLLSRVERVLGRSISPEEHTVRRSARGKYASLTLNLWVTSGDEVYAIYAALGDDERVKYLL